MTVNECAEVVDRLLLAFPALAGDTERCQEISRKIESFPYAVALQAVDEYVNHGGDRFMELTRLLVIAFRIHRELRDREAAIAKALERRTDRDRGQQIAHAIDSVGEFVAEMSDDDVMAEWHKLLAATMKPDVPPRTWCEKYSAAKVRTNIPFRLHIAELRKGRQQVA